MERFVRKSLLFDFYGELLTEKRRAVYRDVVEDDMSYAEAAEIYGISRQGVYDMVKRCEGNKPRILASCVDTFLCQVVIVEHDCLDDRLCLTE